MFSRITIELSTIIPAPKAIPPKVSTLKVISPKYISIQVAINEIGIEIAITSVLRTLRRKMNNTSTASSAPVSRLFTRLSIDISIISAWFMATINVRLPGIVCSSLRQTSRTALAVETVLASLCLLIAIYMASLPF